MHIEPDQLRIEGDARRGQLLFIALAPLRSRRDRHQIPQVADPPMIVSDQVGDALPDAGLVIGEDAIGIEESRRAVDEDHRRPGPTLAEQIAVVVAGGDDDEAIDAARGEGSDQLLFAGLVLVGTSRKDEDTTLEGDILDFAVERRGEGVGDVFEKNADRGALSVRTSKAAGWVDVLIEE